MNDYNSAVHYKKPIKLTISIGIEIIPCNPKLLSTSALTEITIGTKDKQ